MRRFLFALMLVISWAAVAHAADYGSDNSPPARLTALQTWAAPPAGATYSLGGYAPADNTNAPGDPNLIDKGEYPSPLGACGCNGGCNASSGCDCGGLWDGYLARPCHHRHHWMGYGHGCGCLKKGFGGSQCGCSPCGACALPCNQCLPCNSGCGGCGCGGGWGTGYGYAGAAYFSPGCGCVPACRGHHHCKLLHCWKKACGCGCGEVATAGCGESCGSGCGCGCGADGGMPADSSAPGPPPTPAPEMIKPAPAPEPAPSAQRPRIWRSMAAMGGLLNN